MRSTEPPLSNNAKQPNPNNDTTMTNDINRIMVCEQNLDEIDDQSVVITMICLIIQMETVIPGKKLSKW